MLKIPTLSDIHATAARVEAFGLDLISAITPWLAPLPTAYISFDHLQRILGLPFEIAFLGGVVVESIGVAAVHTTFQYWKRGKESGRQSVQTFVAGGMVAAYVATVVTINVLLDSAPLVHLVAKGLLSVMNVISSVVLALRSQYRADELRAQQATGEAASAADRQRATELERERASAELERQRQLAALEQQRLAAELAHQQRLAELQAQKEIKLEQARLRAESATQRNAQRVAAQQSQRATQPRNNVQPDAKYWERSKFSELFEQYYRPGIGATELGRLIGADKATASRLIKSRENGH